MRTVLLGAGLSALLLAQPVIAQKNATQARGFQADKVYQFADVDHINLFNGNVNVVLPIGPRHPVSSALSYQFSLAYGGNDWEVFVNTKYNDPGQEPPTFDEPYATPRLNGNAGFGWHFAFAGTLTISRNCSGCLMFQTPDGGLHQFTPRLHRCDSSPTSQVPCIESANARVQYTSDGTYYRLKEVDEEEIGPLGLPIIKEYYDVSAPDGTVFRFLRVNRNLVHIRDPFGNKVTVTHASMPDGAPKWTIDDGPRQHVVEFINRSRAKGQGFDGDPKTFAVVKTVRLAAVDGQQATYTFDYGPGDELTPMSRLFVEGQDCAVTSKVWIPVLRRILLPDGTDWSFNSDIGDGGITYSRTAGSSNACATAATLGYSGTLLGLRFPTLGRLEWKYGEWFFPAVDPGGVCPDHTSGVSICNAAMSRSVGIRERLEWTKGDNPSQISRRTYENRWFVNPKATEFVTVTTFTRDPGPGTALNTVFSKSRHYFALSNQETANERKGGEYGLPYTPHVVAASAVDADFPVQNPDPIVTGGARLLSSVLYDAAGRIVRYSYAGYEGDDAKMTFGQESNRRPRSERIVYPQPQVTTAGSPIHYTLSASADFDGVGHYRVVTADGDAPGGGTRTTVTNYNRADGDVDLSGRDTGTFPGTFTLPSTDQPWILNTWSTSEVTEAGSGSATARTLAWFDGDTGFLKRTRTLAGSSRGGSDLVTEFTHANGDVTREDYFGGDVTAEDAAMGIQPLTTNEPLAVMTLPTRRYRLEHACEHGVRRQTSYVNAAATRFPSRHWI